MRTLTVILLVFAFSFTLMGCGKKSPPRLPKEPESKKIEAPIETETTVTNTVETK